MNPYFPILLIMAIAIIIGVAMSALSNLLGPKNQTASKSENFECGVPIVNNKEKMSVKFYLTAILFILFDIETIFLYLWAKVFNALGWFGMIEILVFMFILIIGYIFVIKTNALEWD